MNEKINTRVRYHTLYYLLLPLVLLTLYGCSVRLISSYDEQTDKAVTTLQNKFETYLVKLEGLEGAPECTYENNKSFYAGARVDISAIRVRAAAIPKNDITLKEIELLSINLNSLEQLHQHKNTKADKCLSKEEIRPLESAFNTSFTAILKLELAKRRGAAD